MSPGNGNGRGDGRLHELVVVIGQDRQFLYYVTPGRARIMLRSGDARIFGRVPPVVRLEAFSLGAPPEEQFLFRASTEVVGVLDRNGSVLAPTSAAKAAALIRDGKARLVRSSPPSIRLVRIVRETAQRRPTMDNEIPKYLDAQGRIVNWGMFFKEERDIYVRNLTENNISFDFKTAAGDPVPFMLYVTPDPVNLSAEVDFATLKASQSFRRIANAVTAKGRPHVQILSEAEYRRYFELKAESLRTTADEAQRRSDQARHLWREDQRKQMGQNEPKPIHQVVETGTGPAGATHIGERNRVASTGPIMTEDDVIRDRLRVLLHNITQDVLEEQGRSQADGRPFDSNKIKPASAILTEVQTMQDLTEDELAFIQAKCYWPSIKRWCAVRLAEVRQMPAASEVPTEMDDGDAFIQRQGMTG